MTIIDPTGGLGYSYGAKLPSSHMVSVTSQLPYAVDGNGGGTYNPSADIEIGTNTIKLLGTNQLEYASRTIYKVFPIIPYYVSSGTWVQQTSATARNTATAGSTMNIAFPGLPDGQVLTSCEVWYDAAAGHTLLPGMPTFQIFKNSTLGIETDISGGPISDTAANVATYEAAHSWSKTGMSETIDNETYSYRIAIVAEISGADPYLAGADCLGIKLGFTVTSQAEI